MTSRTEHDANSILMKAFHAWDGIHETEGPRASMIVTVADELELAAEALDCDSCLSEVVARVMRRAVARLRLSLEVDAEQVQPKPVVSDSGYLIPKESMLWLAPLGNHGEPAFDEAREATPQDMADRGWVWRESACDAIKVTLRVPVSGSWNDGRPAVDDSSQEEPVSETVKVAS